MSIARDILAFFGVNAFRRDTHEALKADLQPKYSKRQLAQSWGQPFEQGAEVDDLKERYSASKYIEHLRAAMDGDFTGRGEWSRVLTSMSHADAAEFWFEFDELTERGAWVKVLSAEEREQVKANVLEKLDEYRAQGEALMKDFGVPAALMHKLTVNTHDGGLKSSDGLSRILSFDQEAELTDEERALVQQFEDEDLAAWAEDEESENESDDEVCNRGCD